MVQVAGSIPCDCHAESHLTELYDASQSLAHAAVIRSASSDPVDEKDYQELTINCSLIVIFNIKLIAFRPLKNI